MRVGLVPYTHDWSYDLTAKALVQHLSHRFEFQVFHNETVIDIDHRQLDLLVDFWWRGGLARRFGQRVLVQVSSHRWSHDKYGNLTAEQLIEQYLGRAGEVLVPSERLAAELPGAIVCPKGFHPETFFDRGERTGPLMVGFAGNAGAPDKRVSLLRAAWPALRIAETLTQAEMPGFYNSLDVITCASVAEGDPRPLIEGMACGCFPVCVNVGIVPELVRHGENGLIVEPEAFTDALAWCARNVDYVRERGRENAQEMLRTRTWARVSQVWGDTFEQAVANAPEWRVNTRTERIARAKAAIRKRRALRAAADYLDARGIDRPPVD